MNSIYIGSIPNNIDKDDILQRLTELEFISFKIKGKPKVDRRYFVLQTKSIKEYQNLLQQGTIVVKGVQLVPQPFLTGVERRQKDHDIKKKRIYVSDLPAKTTDENLFDLFKKFGRVESAYVSKKCVSKGYKYGFVTFESMKIAQNLVEAGFTQYKGKSISIRQFGDEFSQKNLEEQDKQTKNRNIIEENQSSGIKVRQKREDVNIPDLSGLPDLRGLGDTQNQGYNEPVITENKLSTQQYQQREDLNYEIRSPKIDHGNLYQMNVGSVLQRQFIKPQNNQDIVYQRYNRSYSSFSPLVQED